jgi:hypothetical protein
MDTGLEQYEKVSDIISPQEITQFYDLLKKMHKANAVLDQLENTEEPEPQPEGVVPYQVAIQVLCEVTQKENAITLSPKLVEKLQKIYYIDMTTDNYGDMVESFLDQITETLSQTCSKFIPQPTTENENV